MKQMPNSNTGNMPAMYNVALAAITRALEEGQARMLVLRQRYSMLHGRLKSARAYASDLAWELEELELRLRDLQAPRAGPIDALLEQEVAGLLRHRAELEEQALAQLLEVDELSKQCAAAEQGLATQARTWAAREAELTGERDRLLQLAQAWEDLPETES
jgi:hypothetical protein